MSFFRFSRLFLYLACPFIPLCVCLLVSLFVVWFIGMFVSSLLVCLSCTFFHFFLILRNMGVGMGSFISRIGSISSPYILYLGDHTFFQFPFLVFGSCSFLAGILTLLLPETLGAKLPETIEEGEAFGK